MKRLCLIVLSSCIHVPSYAPLLTPGQYTTVISDVSVFDGASDQLLEHQDVTLANGFVASIEPARGGTGDIDGKGLTLLPGLIDYHVHSTLTSAPPWYLTIASPKHNLEAQVAAGVTSIVDMGGDEASLSAMKEHIARGEWTGPRIFYAGRILTAKDGYPVTMLREGFGKLAEIAVAGQLVTQVSADSDLERLVRERWASGASLVKVVVASLPAGAPRLDESQLTRIVRTAHQFGLRVAAHIDTAQDALLAAKVGVDILAHGVETDRLTDAQAKQICDSGMAVIPTLVNYDRFDQVNHRHYVGSEMETRLEDASVIASFSDEQLRRHEMPPVMKPWADAIDAHRFDRPLNALKLYQAGCQVLTGSDSQGSIGTFTGAIHEELRMLVDAGVPAATVLRAATSQAGESLQRGLGRVRIGAAADLILIRGNPLVDIRRTREIHTVFLRGQRMLPAAR